MIGDEAYRDHRLVAISCACIAATAVARISHSFRSISALLSCLDDASACCACAGECATTL